MLRIDRVMKEKNLAANELGTSTSDDWFKFNALTHDECHFVSEFNTDNGRIHLTMSKMGYNTASVVIKYIDDANATETRKKVMEDL